MILLDKELLAMNEYKNVSEEAIKKGLKPDGVVMTVVTKNRS